MTIGLYHGSNVALEVGDYLIPKSSQILNGESVVYATSMYEFALMFINKWGDDEMELGSINNQFYIKEKYKDAFGQVFKKNKGYIYLVDSETFVADERLMNIEFISRKKVKILEKIEVKNILKEIVNSGIFKIKYCYK